MHDCVCVCVNEIVSVCMCECAGVCVSVWHSRVGSRGLQLRIAREARGKKKKEVFFVIIVRPQLRSTAHLDTRLCPAKSRKYLTTATYPNERWGMEALHLPVRVVAPKWSHSTQTPCLRIALAGLSVKHFANGRVAIPHPNFSAECAESRFIHFV